MSGCAARQAHTSIRVKLGKARQKNAPEDIKSHLGGALPETRHGARVYGTRGLCSITANPLHQKVLCHHDAGDRTKSKSMSRSVPVRTDILKSPAVRLD
jgi:hypothetical protein